MDEEPKERKIFKNSAALEILEARLRELQKKPDKAKGKARKIFQKVTGEFVGTPSKREVSLTTFIENTKKESDAWLKELAEFDENKDQQTIVSHVYSKFPADVQQAIRLLRDKAKKHLEKIELAKSQLPDRMLDREEVDHLIKVSGIKVIDGNITDLQSALKGLLAWKDIDTPGNISGIGGFNMVMLKNMPSEVAKKLSESLKRQVLSHAQGAISEEKTYEKTDKEKGQFQWSSKAISQAQANKICTDAGVKVVEQNKEEMRQALAKCLNLDVATADNIKIECYHGFRVVSISNMPPEVGQNLDRFLNDKPLVYAEKKSEEKSEEKTYEKNTPEDTSHDNSSSSSPRSGPKT